MRQLFCCIILLQFCEIILSFLSYESSKYDIARMSLSNSIISHISINQRCNVNNLDINKKSLHLNLMKSEKDNILGSQNGQLSFIEKVSSSSSSRDEKRNSKNNNDNDLLEEIEVGNDILASTPSYVNSFLIGGGIFLLLLIGRYEMVDSGFDFGQLLQQAATQIESMGPTGYLYFGVLYTIAEILAVPATPLTASAGYLFGLFPGTITVLVSATIAAAVSFAIGRTALRSWAESLASNNAQWRAIDKAVSKEGFKVVLLLRLSPLLPFALSNYLYALTSIKFTEYIAATFLGFAPGTFGIVYAGSAGKDLLNGSNGIPWYVYVGGAACIALAGQTIGKIASEAVKDIEEEED